jgi:amino acid adenylation domain-containing protein
VIGEETVVARGLGPRRSYRTGCGLHQLFEESVDRRPDRPAVEYEGVPVTYAELDGRANDLAHHLVERGLRRGGSVGICVGRSPVVATALLATLKAGGVCVPLDPTYPPGRLAAMAADAGVEILLTTAQHRTLVEGDHVVVAVAEQHGSQRGGAPRLDLKVDDSDLAYMISTSGSTGVPKSVMLRHGGLVNHAQAAVEIYGITGEDRLLQVSSISFDISIEEMFPLWHAGGTVVFRPGRAALSGRQFLADMRALDISVLDMPTALWSEWTRDLQRLGERPPDRLRALIVGGEKAQPATLASWKRSAGDSVRWFNTYGPTETSVIATAWEAPGATWNPRAEVPLGSPVPNVNVYILDPDLRPVGAGERGEIFIGGAGVAAGYRERPDLTASRFLSDPFAPGATMYRTGDLAAWDAAGNLTFVGRDDDQVKIRGFRVEPGEVTSALNQHPDVAESLVVAKTGDDGQKRLIAYTVAHKGGHVDEGPLWVFLARKLPSYMVPSAFVNLASFPLTPNGKIDRAALPEPPRPRRLLPTPPEPPRNADEEKVAKIWREVLDLDEVGVEDDFFQLGGFSIAAVWMLGEVEAQLGRPVPLPAFFANPTVARLVEALDADPTSRRTALQAVSPGGGATPLVHVCTAEPGVMALRHFVAELGADRPVYALVLKRLKGFEEAGTTVEQLANEAYADLVQEFPSGPIVLTGYSVGGLLAYELAARLTAQGRLVEKMCLLDTWSPLALSRSALASYWVERLVLGGGDGWRGRWATSRHLAGASLRRLRRLQRRLLRRGRSGLGGKVQGSATSHAGPPADDEEEADHVKDMYFRYRPPRLTCRCALFRTEATAKELNSRLGWRRRDMARLEVITVPGQHGTIMREPHVKALAAAIHAGIR